MSLPGLIVTPLTQRDVAQAVSLMKEYGLDYEDALHLAAALRSKVREIISNDQDFDKTPLKRRFS
jgi:predicted nucleic acid-binding protein